MIHTQIEPAFNEWEPPPSAPERSELIEAVNANAKRLGTGRIDAAAGDQPSAIIATGHQAFFYHPGILAKDIAAEIAAARFGASPLHLVVDQDVHEVLGLEMPSETDGRLSVSNLRLGQEDQQVPTGFQPSDPALRGLRTGVSSAPSSPSPSAPSCLRASVPSCLASVLSNLPQTRTLAEQITAALARLREPFAGNLPVLFCSDLPRLSAFRDVVDAMLEQPRRCALAYNQAVSAHPEAGIGPLAVELDRIELPLWACRWETPRMRVFADVADSMPRLVDERDQPVTLDSDDGTTILPRALTMTAVMRSQLCDRFIHGTGGWTYDRITEHWWRQWRGEPLAPMALVTADVRLDFNVPRNDHAELERALWHAHHLPHNLDRELDSAQLDGQQELVHRKADLLAHMDDDRDRKRRRHAFHEIHRINNHLTQTHPGPIHEAQSRLNHARLGLANQHLTQKRDWPFPLYPNEKLNALRHTLERESPPAVAGGSA